MLTKEILCAYLPYDLNLWHEGYEPKHILDVTIPKGVYDRPMNAVSMISMLNGNSKLKPMFRPLSSLTKPITHNGETFVSYQRLFQFASNMGIHKGTFEHMLDKIIDGYVHVTELPYYLVQKILSWHFDIFGLLESGHAIELKEVTEESKYTESKGE